MLTTVDRVKANMDITGSGADVTIAEIIAAVSIAIARYCNRADPRSGASLLERTVDRVEYPRIVGDKAVLRCYPIESVSEVLQAADRDWDTADELVEDEDWVLDDRREDALVHLNSAWLDGIRMVRVTYTGGYYTGDTENTPEGAIVVPEDLVQAATLQSAHEHKNSNRFGERNVQVASMVITQIVDGMLGIVKDKLEPFVNRA